MNPICQTDINSPECQIWMSEVCTHCREMFDRESSDTWAAWWHDESPALYKDVPAMSVYDCNKLKHLLQMEVASLVPISSTTAAGNVSQFKLWQKILLISMYIGIMVILSVLCRCWKLGRHAKLPSDEKEEKEAPPKAPPQSTPEVTPLPTPKPVEVRKTVKRKHRIKTWVRKRCRPIFLHNEAALRHQQAKYKEKELLKEAHTQEKVEKWTKAEKKIETNQKEKTDALHNKKQTRQTDDNEKKLEETKGVA